MSRSAADLTNPSFLGIDRLSVISFENEADRIGHTGHNLQIKKLKCFDWWKKQYKKIWMY